MEKEVAKCLVASMNGERHNIYTEYTQILHRVFTPVLSSSNR